MKKYVSVGVGIVINREDKILLLKRKNVHGDGTWSTPGGSLEFGETPEQCALREVKEEVGLEIADVKFKAMTNDFFEQEGKHYISIWMEGKYIGGEAIINADYEMSDVGWFAWTDLPRPLFLSLQNLLEGKCYS